MKGDRIEVLIDTGTGVRSFELKVTRAGRRLEVSLGRGTLEISELTRTNRPTRSARFMASRVVALVEHPAADQGQEASKPVPEGLRGPDAA